MNNIDPAISRSPFFPKSRQAKTNSSMALERALKRNSFEKQKEIENTTKNDARVDIPASIKDFSRIKSAVYKSQPTDNSDKIAALKNKINSGTYQMDYEGIADKMLKTEF